ncbi:hypothetical protein KCU67_g17363, partial [Aureobasidium melanogenum]
MVSWISCNSFDPKKRGIAVALFGTIHEIGSVAAAQIYREKDKPYYYTGNKDYESRRLAQRNSNHSLASHQSHEEFNDPTSAVDWNAVEESISIHQRSDIY